MRGLAWGCFFVVKATDGRRSSSTTRSSSTAWSNNGALIHAVALGCGEVLPVGYATVPDGATLEPIPNECDTFAKRLAYAIERGGHYVVGCIPKDAAKTT